MYATTNGDVREGPLDDLIEKSKMILEGSIPDNGLLPFICKLDDRDEVKDPANWEKANPSLPYLPSLREEIEKEYADWLVTPSNFTAFMTKRMNIPDGNAEIAVTSWENIKACSAPVPKLDGLNAIGALDFASTGDFVSAGVLIPKDAIWYWFTHSWLCTRSADLPRLKCPWRDWADMGLLTVVDDVEISPAYPVQWIAEQAKHYNISMIALDNFRYGLMRRELENIGFSAKDHKNVKLVRPSDIMIVSPIIASKFAKTEIAYGDNPVMRWAVNNTKMIRTGINRDTGNMTYGKIEGRTRKNDPFMAFVAAATCEPDISNQYGQTALDNFGVWSM